MKRQKEPEPFIRQLRRKVRSLKDMKPGEVHVLSVVANYGRYQIAIGVEKQSDSPAGKRRPIEISGEIHHLFVSPHAARVHPSKHQMDTNLKNTVIMRDLSIHLNDPKGDGRHLTIEDRTTNGIAAKEYINLAGKEGEHIVEHARRERWFPMATYRIIQKDILNSLRDKEESPE